MSSGARAPLADGLAAARDVCDLLAPGVVRIEIAGSIRRQVSDVGDIEVVAVPVMVEREEGMWETRVDNALSRVIDMAIAAGVLRSHPTDPKRGDRYSKVVHSDSGLQVDIFSARPHSFGTILLIRTGPRDYSQRFVTDLRRHGLHHGKGEIHKGGLGCGEYACNIVPTPEEADVYAAVGSPWVRPESRS